MKNIVIIGAGDLGKEVVWLIEDINRVKPTYLILGFLDDDMSKNTYSFCGYRVLGGTDKLEELNAISPFSSVYFCFIYLTVPMLSAQVFAIVVSS